MKTFFYKTSMDYIKLLKHTRINNSNNKNQRTTRRENGDILYNKVHVKLLCWVLQWDLVNHQTNEDIDSETRKPLPLMFERFKGVILKQNWDKDYPRCHNCMVCPTGTPLTDS